MNAAKFRSRHDGFTLVELMVALTLGLVLVLAMLTGYLASKTAYTRQQQVSSMQQSVRIAFEYLAGDARTVGHAGCYTRLPMAAPGFVSPLLATDLAGNVAVGIEGYEFHNPTAGEFTLASLAPADVNTAASWESNVSSDGINTIPLTAITASTGLTPGSDVLVIRGAAGRPVRLAAAANVGAGQSSIRIETLAAGGTCSDDRTPKVSGFCPHSRGLIASCTRARVFEVATTVAAAGAAAATLNLVGNMGSDPAYDTAGAEVFMLQTVTYYIKQSASGETTSLYRRIFDGDHANGLEQELVEGVENLQLLYGVDTTTPTPDGSVDEYVTAQNVGDWSRVVAVRMSLVVRAVGGAELDVTPATSATVNGVVVTYPTTGRRYDRRVFTTTVALRNRIAYF